MEIKNERVIEALEKAQDAFWKTFSEEFPEIKSGDFPPDETIVFSRACFEAGHSWIFYNGQFDAPHKFKVQVRG